jgi:L-asparaginase II
MRESLHRVHAVAVRDGEIVDARGDPALVTFLRSSAKPLQALPLARLRPDLEDDQLAIACASHRAEPAQLDAVRRLLDRSGATEDDLECGAQEARGPERIRHNCSGKHAGFLLVCRERGWPTRGYRLPEHPLQRELTAIVADVAGMDPAAATDGCGVVTFALALERIARAFAGLSRVDGASRVLAAMRARPELVGGEGSLDTELMRARPGWVAKGGAEGLLCAVSADGVGVVLKAEDGNQRPLGPALAQFLGFEEFERVPVTNSRGEEVGEVRV